MVNFDLTPYLLNADPSEFSASMAERGKNAGSETWENSLNAATTAQPPIVHADNRSAAIAYFREFGAWEDLDTWSNENLADLCLQYAMGDFRESLEDWIEVYQDNEGKPSIAYSEDLDLDYFGSEGRIREWGSDDEGEYTGCLYIDGDRVMVELTH
jgi:hypothetical protein